MYWISMILCCLVSGGVMAMPQSLPNQLDKATVNDVAVNSVSPDSAKVAISNENGSAENSTDRKDGANVQITGITTGFNGEIPEQPFKPPRASSMFARFIDDIFQIPISVLQNVAKLITSPFVSRKTVPVAQEPSTIIAT